MSERQTRYVSYLLRLWQDNDDQNPMWRASLQNSLTGERMAFASVDQMFAFVHRQLGLARNKRDNGQPDGDR